MDPVIRKVKNYLDIARKSPFREWIAKKIDGGARGRINARIRRIEEFGIYGDCEPVGDGIYELKLDTGPGYRVYFGIDGGDIVLLLGGVKATQNSDIEKAKQYWEDYNA